MPDPLNNRFIKALLRQPVDRAPMWLMRQAGRYLPEYRALRARTKNFFTFCETPELVCEATLQPIQRFSLDAAIIFSDILMVPRAMGCEITMDEREGPIASHPMREANAIRALEINVIEKLQCVAEGIKLTQKKLENKLPLIGFAGSPWTVATYMVEGKSSKTFEIIKSMLYKNPALLHHLLQKITQVSIDYLKMQLNAGADVIMLFDTWGGVLSQEAYNLFSLTYMKTIIAALKKTAPQTPIIVFSKNCGLYFSDIVSSGCDAIGIDWTMDVLLAKKIAAGAVAIQGNLGPAILLSSPETIIKEAQKILSVFQGETGFVFNVGHGISKETPISHVETLVETVRTFKNL